MEKILILLLLFSPIPTPFSMGGENWVYYELQFKNLTGKAVRLNSLKINGENKPIPNETVQAGAAVLLYLEVKPGKAKQLLHELSYTGGTINYTVPLNTKAPLIIDAPLTGDHWQAVYDPSWLRGHRRVTFTIGNVARIPGRFAIDFMKVDTAGQFSTSTSDSVKNWYGYAADVLAVADGTIAAALDTFQESKTLAAHPGYDSSRATGNYISLKIADSTYAFYEHLKPGSIRVKPGEHVKAGQVIGSLGFTGQSTGPHLHFHIADHNSPLGAQGIPFVFRSFNGHHKNERPVPNAVISFAPPGSDL